MDVSPIEPSIDLSGSSYAPPARESAERNKTFAKKNEATPAYSARISVDDSKKDQRIVIPALSAGARGKNPGREPTLRHRFYITGNLRKERPSTRRLDRRHSIDRSEERRVGKECRSRWSPDH